MLSSMTSAPDPCDSNSSFAEPVTTIKKYPNRRLYDPGSSRYVTLGHVAQMVKDGKDFVVTDAKTGEDLTRSVLTQIIVEQEGRGQSLFSTGFLRQIIGLYGDNLSRVVPHYLEHTMQSFSRNEDRLRSAMKSAWDGLVSSLPLEEINKRNQVFFENARGLLRSFKGAERPTLASEVADDAAINANEREIDSLKSHIAALQKELESRLADREHLASLPATGTDGL